jgi:hypothetical protein
VSSGNIGLRLHSRKGSDPHLYIPLPEPKILASLRPDCRSRKGVIEVNFGIRGVPAGTRQVVFFSDDEDLCDPTDGETLGSLRCAITRRRPSRNDEIWCERREAWDVVGDFRIFAMGVTEEGRRWTASSNLRESLERWYAISGSDLPQCDFDAVIEMLDRWEGNRLHPQAIRQR